MHASTLQNQTDIVNF